MATTLTPPADTEHIPTAAERTAQTLTDAVNLRRDLAGVIEFLDAHWVGDLPPLAFTSGDDGVLVRFVAQATDRVQLDRCAQVLAIGTAICAAYPRRRPYSFSDGGRREVSQRWGLVEVQAWCADANVPRNAS